MIDSYKLIDYHVVTRRLIYQIRIIRCYYDKIVNNEMFVIFPMVSSDNVNIAVLIDLGAINEGASRRPADHWTIPFCTIVILAST